MVLMIFVHLRHLPHALRHLRPLRLLTRNHSTAVVRQKKQLIPQCRLAV